MVTIFIRTVNKFSKNTRGLNFDIPAQSFDVDTYIAYVTYTFCHEKKRELLKKINEENECRVASLIVIEVFEEKLYIRFLI